MKPFRHTLISDGRTDANLIPIIDWTLREVGGVELPEGTHAEFWRLDKPPRRLDERILKAVELFPCEVLFIHRDAEREPRRNRIKEIKAAVLEATAKGFRLPAVTVIPVRMLEAWLLFDERAIRHAAGNPNGTCTLALPARNKLEDRPNPKADLRQALRTASELTGRRLEKFNTAHAFWRIAGFLDDFSPLRELPAYLAFERAVRSACKQRWTPGFYEPDEPATAFRTTE